VLFVATLVEINLRMGRADDYSSKLGTYWSPAVPDRGNVCAGDPCVEPENTGEKGGKTVPFSV